MDIYPPSSFISPKTLNPKPHGTLEHMAQDLKEAKKLVAAAEEEIARLGSFKA